MTDIHDDVSQRFRAAARTLDIVQPPPRSILDRVARRRRRRASVRLGAGTAAVVLAVGGVALLGARADDPAPAPVGTVPLSTVGETVAPPITPSTTLAPPVVVDGSFVADRWTRLPDHGLAERSEHLAVATDSGVLIWGGYPPDVPVPDGAYLDLATRTWRTLPPAPLTLDRGDAVGVWTGREVVVVNGVGGRVEAAAFDPASFTWRELADPPVDNAANAAAQIAMVGETIVLFSVIEDNGPARNEVVRLDGVTGDWAAVPAPPVPVRSGVKLVATDREVVAVGFHDDGLGCPEIQMAAYAPDRNIWRTLDPGPVADRVEDAVVVWTGSELFVGGGALCPGPDGAAALSSDAALLDMTTGTWRTTSPAPIGFTSSYRYPSGWTGQSMAVVTYGGTPLLYHPATDAWHLGPAIDELPIAPNQTPAVVIDGTIVVSGGLRVIDGEPSNDAFVESYAYSIPDGF